VPAPERQVHPSGAAAAMLGALSAASLGAAFLWAHHWNPLTVSIVAVWVASTIWCFAASRRALRWGERRASRGGAFGMTVVGLSLLVLLGVGVASAFGADPGAMCGGG
jgi:hypothetical protein